MRQSNIELLRIVSMFFVLTLHVVGIGLTLKTTAGEPSLFKSGIESLCLIAVNCFVMISGYFSIRLRIKSVISFIITCIFYSLLISSIFFILFPKYCTGKDLLFSLFPFGHSNWWFIPPYLGLMLLAPMINTFLEKLDKKKYLLFLGILTYINIYYGWFWGKDPNPTGYTLSQFIYLYCIGYYLKSFPLRISKAVSFSIYLLLSAIGTAAIFYMVSHGHEYLLHKYVLAYNNPLVILSAAAFFLVFTKIRIQSRSVNYLAVGAFAVYLVHMHPCVKIVLFPWINGLQETFTNPGMLFTILLAGEVAFMLVIMTADRLRNMLTEPIAKRCSEIISRKLPWANDW